MPNYNIRLGNQRFRFASTDKPVSRAIGKHLAGVTPETKVDSRGGHHSYSFDGQEIDFEDLRDIKDIRDSGGQVAQLMKFKALLNFGEGAEFHVENEDEEYTQLVDGEEMTLTEWLEQEAFPRIDLLVLDLGEDALWYPAAYGELRENQVGEFAEFLPSEPWTILPETNPHGEVTAYHQRVQQNSGHLEQTLAPEDIMSIILNKQSARDKTGISEVLRNRDEIQAFKENEQAINQAIELHGFPQRHVKVGREDGAPIRDDDLRRVRTIFDPKTSDANTAYFTGQDVDVDTLEAHQFDYSAIHEMDMRNLTTALGLPLEAGNVGSDGLGSGKPAELRFALLKLAIKANQRSFSTQFISKVVRPVLRDYSPFDHTAPVSMEIDDPLEDIGEMAEVIGKIGDYMTNAEIRRKLDLPEPEDDEIAEGYQSPAQIEAPEGEGGDDPMGDMGFFREARSLQTPEGVPSNAVSISDRSEAPEGASVVQGPGGGLYYVPGGGGGDEQDGGETGSAAGRGDNPNPTVDLDNEVDSMGLGEAGITQGSEDPNLRIAQLDDGSEVFVEEDKPEMIAEPELIGAAVYEQLDLPIPDHHYYDETGEMAKEGIEGETLFQLGGDAEDYDRESVVDAFAATLITGDTDMHSGNMMIREDGTAVPIDVDGTGGPVRDKDDQRNKIESVLEFGGIDDVEYDEIWDRAQELAGDVDVDALPDAESDLGGIATDNIRENIEAIQA